jgi:hypothetical protein
MPHNLPLNKKMDGEEGMKMKKLTPCLTIVAILSCSIMVHVSPSAVILPGNMIGSTTFNPSTGPDFDSGVAADSTGVYVVGYDSRPGARA